MLLIFPPVFRPSEPPAGIARLSGFLKSRGVPCRTVDLNYRLFSDMLERGAMVPGTEGAFTEDTFTRRAYKNRERNLTMIRSPEGYGGLDRYIKMVHELNRAAASSVSAELALVSLSDYQERGKNPLTSNDLIAAFLHPEESPLYPWFVPVIDNLLIDNAPENRTIEPRPVVGLSLCFLSQALPAFAMAGYVRKAAPGVRIVLGGSLVTSWMRLPDWSNPFDGVVDLLVQGLGEEELLSWLTVCTKEELGEWARVSGMENPDMAGFFSKTCVRARVRPFSFALPDYGDMRANRYLSPGFILPYAASAGCSWKRCAFCPEHAEGQSYVSPAPGETITQLSALLHETAPAAVHFLDNEMSPALLRALADTPPAAFPVSLPTIFPPIWYGFTRFHKDLTDPDYCLRLKDSGCVMLKLGLESGSQSVLDKSGKGIDLDLAAKVLRSLKTAGIGVYLYLLFGTPWEGYDEALETLDFAASHGEYIGFLNLALFNMPRGGALAGEYKTTAFDDADLSLYTDFVHPKAWNRLRVRRFLGAEFKRHPNIAPIVRRHPPFFGSSHAPFLPIV